MSESSSTFRWYRQRIINDETGEIRTRCIGTGRDPFDLALYERNAGWRVLGPIEELDKAEISRVARTRVCLAWKQILEARNPGRRYTVSWPEEEPPKVIAVHER